PAKSGLGSAYRDGFRHGLAAGYDVMVEMDSDLSHDPAALPSLLAAVADGAALALGSRYIPGGSIPDWSWHRRALSRWGNRYAAAVLGIDVNDATSGYRAYRAEALAKIDFHTVQADGYGFQVEMAYRVLTSGGRIVEVPISFTDRVRGESKMSSRIVVEALVLVTWWAIRDRILRIRRGAAELLNACHAGGMRRWQVAGGLLTDSRGLLLVANRRRNGSVDWSTPGGVVDEGETPIVALSREVTEETGLIVDAWAAMRWTVEVTFVDLDMHLMVEVHEAASFSGDLSFDDPDGIVHDGDFLDQAQVHDRIRSGPAWVADPLAEWLAEPWSELRQFRYDAVGERSGELRAARLDP
ncbi:MAG: NUDIX domain-containing protein, partial [Acidimicrobiaceae bacterium]